MAPEIENPETLALAHGLTRDEYTRIRERLGRTPSITEIGIYSVMWSEHCSYKNSVAVLKTLPRTGAALLVEAGDENAGLVDIGGGLAVAFKMESHNHPSAVEPYQGAATGVGGIHRDIFTMGARPICALNSLRFGTLDNPRVRYLLDGVVRGIGDYGNAFGVPTVAGEVYFDASYEGNPLVNAMSVGIVKKGMTASAIAEGVGNRVYIVGAATGRDGIHGATFASEEISEASEAKRPSVQVGDPFTEKLLLEATLEALREGIVVGIQDMGAAGITCSSCEMSAKGGVGMRLDLDKVPVRETDMSAYEIMLSESQERMLVVCESRAGSALEQVFAKWDLHAAQIGEVTSTGVVEVWYRGERKATVPAEHLVLGGGAPVYKRESRLPEYIKRVRLMPELPDLFPSEAQGVLERLLNAPNIASKRWVYEQYDTMVRTDTVIGPGASDAAVLRIKGIPRGLAVSADGNGRYVYLNPRRGGQIAVAEAARNVVCAGGKPLAITNCLNFGNPYKPEVYWTFQEAVCGIGEACRALGTPVTGGNVSFYNENPGGAVFPTPTIGMLGLIKDVNAHRTGSNFAGEGDAVFLLTPREWTHRGSLDDLGGSEYLADRLQKAWGDAPYLDLQQESAVQTAMLKLIERGFVRSAHDVSDGGLAVCVAECALRSGGIGAEISLNPAREMRLDALLFSEAQSRIVFTTPQPAHALQDALPTDRDVTLTHIGTTRRGVLRITVWETAVVQSTVEHLASIHDQAIPRMLAAEQ